MADSRDITGKNRKFTGTTGIKLPAGSTAQRVDETGQIRFNNETNLAEYYTGTDWKAIDAPPTITQFTVDGGADVTSAFIDASAGGNATIEVKGSLFDTTGANVTFVGTSETISTQSITRNSANLLTVTVARSDFDNANEPYAIKVTNGSGLSAELADAINQDSAPAFVQAAGNLGTAYNTVSATFDGSAIDADSDTITYSISSGALPSGLSINSSTGSITGTPSGNSAGDFTFTVSAATTSVTATRQFIITIEELPSGGTITSGGGTIRIHTFTSSGNFVVPSGFSKTGSVLSVAGGGGGGSSGNGPSWCDGGGGGGAGGLVYSSSVSLTAGTKSIVIGAGGSGGSGSGGGQNQGGDGGNTTTDSLVTNSVGGGGGAFGSRAVDGLSDGRNGGSGGGHNNYNNSGSNTPGQGTAGQGNNGGQSNGDSQSGTGGGGAGAAGASISVSNGNSTGGSAGGVGLDYNISGSSTFYAGGGGGGSAAETCSGVSSSYTGNPGGNGGGGHGGSGTSNSNITAGTANTGGGGGGSSGSNGQNTNYSGANGGSGVVIVRYDYS